MHKTTDLRPSTSSSNWKKPNWHDRVDDSLPRSDFQPRKRGLLNPSCSALLLGWNHACVAQGNSIKAHGFNNACAGHDAKKSVYLGDARALAGDASRVKSWTMQDAHKQGIHARHSASRAGADCHIRPTICPGAEQHRPLMSS